MSLDFAGSQELSKHMGLKIHSNSLYSLEKVMGRIKIMNVSEHGFYGAHQKAGGEVQQ